MKVRILAAFVTALTIAACGGTSHPATTTAVGTSTNPSVTTATAPTTSSTTTTQSTVTATATRTASTTTSSTSASANGSGGSAIATSTTTSTSSGCGADCQPAGTPSAGTRPVHGKCPAETFYLPPQDGGPALCIPDSTSTATTP